MRSRKLVSTRNRHGLVGSMGAWRRMRRQRRDGVILRATATQRPRPLAVGHPRTTPDRDRHLDRTDLPPQTPPSPPRPIDPDRIRDHHQHRRNRGMTPKLSPVRASVPIVHGQHSSAVSVSHVAAVVSTERRSGCHRGNSLWRGVGSDGTTRAPKVAARFPDGRIRRLLGGQLQPWQRKSAQTAALESSSRRPRAEVLAGKSLRCTCRLEREPDTVTADRTGVCRQGRRATSHGRR